MIWAVGAGGMLGQEVVCNLPAGCVRHVASDVGTDIVDELAVRARLGDSETTCIVDCAAYMAVDRAGEQ